MVGQFILISFDTIPLIFLSLHLLYQRGFMNKSYFEMMAKCHFVKRSAIQSTLSGPLNYFHTFINASFHVKKSCTLSDQVLVLLLYRVPQCGQLLLYTIHVAIYSCLSPAQCNKVHFDEACVTLSGLRGKNPTIFNIIRWDDGTIIPPSDGPNIILIDCEEFSDRVAQ